MNNKKTFLNSIIGETIKKTNAEISTIIPLKKNKEDVGDELTLVYSQLYFDNYTLLIYNNYKIICNNNQAIKIDELVNSRVLRTNEEKDFVELIFDNNCKLIVDLRDDAYNGPDAMCLKGPNDLFVVWN